MLQTNDRSTGSREPSPRPENSLSGTLPALPLVLALKSGPAAFGLASEVVVSEGISANEAKPFAVEFRDPDGGLLGFMAEIKTLACGVGAAAFGVTSVIAGVYGMVHTVSEGAVTQASRGSYIVGAASLVLAVGLAVYGNHSARSQLSLSK